MMLNGAYTAQRWWMNTRRSSAAVLEFIARQRDGMREWRCSVKKCGKTEGWTSGVGENGSEWKKEGCDSERERDSEERQLSIMELFATPPPRRLPPSPHAAHILDSAFLEDPWHTHAVEQTGLRRSIAVWDLCVRDMLLVLWGCNVSGGWGGCLCLCTVRMHIEGSRCVSASKQSKGRRATVRSSSSSSIASVCVSVCQHMCEGWRGEERQTRHDSWERERELGIRPKLSPPQQENRDSRTRTDP